MFGRRGDHPLPEMTVPLKLVDFAAERLKPSTPAMTRGTCRKIISSSGWLIAAERSEKLRKNAALVG